MIKSIAEVITEVSENPSKNDKIAILRSYPYPALKEVLKNTYDKNVVFLIPNTAPPYTEADVFENQGALIREIRKLRYVIKGNGYDELNQVKRENIFIELLETVHREDAKILINMIQQKPIKGITINLLNEAFGEDFIAQPKKEEKN